ncbi:MAG: mutL [Francisellaceae bacterium]|nr:mutL [Francisellaceae bacterium]
MRIKLLPNHLANQIAAGEVVERPSSILKELLENSLDAGSTQIDITIEKGGIGLIKILDNGKGIIKEDLPLALHPHATSKIHNFHDLECLHTFGFRGEALASIGSVSRLKLSSRLENEEYGWQITQSGSLEHSAIRPVAHPIGTCVEVADLFYNTPARRKFLRSEKTELYHLEELFKRIALSHFSVGFSFNINLRNQLRLLPCTTMQDYNKRIQQLCGNSFIKHAFYIESESNGLVLKGWLSNINFTKPLPDLQFFYVNNRLIRDKLVTHAIRQIYQNKIPLGRYPAFILYLELDPESVDVNVHPTKHEVRFREARTIHAFITHTLQEAINKQEDSAQVFNTSNSEEIIAKDIIESNKTEIITSSPSLIPIKNPHSVVLSTMPTLAAKENTFGKFICMLANDFIITQNQDWFYLIDIKECIKLIKIQQFRQGLKKVEPLIHNLIFPKIVKIKENMLNLERIGPLLLRWGIEADWLGPDRLRLRKIPNCLVESRDPFYEQFLIKFNDPNITEGELLRVMAEEISDTFVLQPEKVNSFLQELSLLKKEEHNNFLSNKSLFKKLSLSDIKSFM